MYLVLALLNKADMAEKAVARFKQHALGEPWFIRARSAAQVLSTDVPIFGGLRSLALGDEDKLLGLTLLDEANAEELGKRMGRAQLEMDADDPPMGRLFALPLLSGSAPVLPAK